MPKLSETQVVVLDYLARGYLLHVYRSQQQQPLQGRVELVEIGYEDGAQWHVATWVPRSTFRALVTREMIMPRAHYTSILANEHWTLSAAGRQTIQQMQQRREQ